ncbi:MAG TPA: hypothetical protein VJ953_17025 [Saprospiraceae bacterium]|nr:hypothetical protein [Saprospiraceae bacterium]
MNQLTLQYPAWYLLLCIVLGLLFAAGLYYKDTRFREKSNWLNWVLASLRFLAVAIASFFLLSPLLRAVERQVKKPIVVIGQDASQSVANALEDSAVLPGTLSEIAGALEEDFDVRTYSFGTQVRPGLDTGFTDKVSNLTEMLQTVNDLYSGENLGAVIMASDGIYNEGSNPAYFNGQYNVPIYTIALGDTTPQKDLLIKRAFHNRIAYLGDRFSVQVDILAQNASGQGSTLSVYRVAGGQTTRLQQFDINIDRNDFFTTQEVILEANVSGLQRYRFVLSSIDGEVSTVNNRKDIFVDVLDARQKILVLAAAPHPDLTALKQSIETNKNYEVTIQTLAKFDNQVEEYDFAILHQLPSRDNPANFILNALNEAEIPRWYIAGMQTDFNQLSNVQSLLTVATDGRNTNDVQGRFAPGFSYFTIDEDLKSELPNFPPLVAPFGEFSEGAGAQILLFQRIRKIDTQFPLLVLGEENGLRTGVLAAEGLWKWRLFDYLQNENHDLFDGFISKIVQFISLKEDKRKFRVTMPENMLDENEAVVMDAELYNQNYELINEPDVSVIIVDEDGQEYNYIFNKLGNAYSLNAGILPVGSYRYTARVNTAGEQLSTEGQFSIQPIQLESYATTANHTVLNLLSERYGGRMVSLEQATELVNTIQEEEAIAPVIYSTTKNKPLINLRWLFFVLLVLLSTEWFLRRYFGAY